MSVNHACDDELRPYLAINHFKQEDKRNSLDLPLVECLVMVRNSFRKGEYVNRCSRRPARARGSKVDPKQEVEMLIIVSMQVME